MTKEKKAKKKLYSRLVSGVTALMVTIGAIGIAAADEENTYDAPDLRLMQGQEVYDLTEGIRYDADKYTLSIEDIGGFDINVPGTYEVRYALTPNTVGADDGSADVDNNDTQESVPVIPEETQPDQVEDEAGDEQGGGSTESYTPEETDAEDEAGADSRNDQPESDIGNSEESTAEDSTSTESEESVENADGTATTDIAKSSLKTILERLVGTAYAEEIPATEEGVVTEDQEPASEESAEGDVTAENPEATEEVDETEKSEGAQTPETTEAPENVEGTESVEVPESTEESAADTSQGAEGETTAGDQIAGAEQDTRQDSVIRFTRKVIVEPAAANIKYKNEKLQIAANTQLYTMVQIGDEKDADQDIVTEEDAATAGMEEPEQTEEAAGEEPKDSSYELRLTNAEALLEDAFVEDAEGKILDDVAVYVSEDAQLKEAIQVTWGEDGTPVVEDLMPGEYTILLAAVDPDTGNEITRERTIEVVPAKEVLFNAPTLYIGTKNETFDLTADMTATDELGNAIEDIYVVDEKELLDARETLVDEATGEEYQCFVIGSYTVTLGAKHPETGEEFLVKREVEVTEGYFIYALELVVEAGSTDYDLTEGAELRNADTEEVIPDAKIEITDMSDLYRGDVSMMMEDQGLEQVSEPVVTDEVPSLEVGTYTVTLAAENPDQPGENVVVQRTVSATRAVSKNMSMIFEATAYGDRITNENYKEGDIDRLAMPAIKPQPNGRYGKQLYVTETSETTADCEPLTDIIPEGYDQKIRFTVNRSLWPQGSSGYAPNNYYIYKYDTNDGTLANKAEASAKWYAMAGVRRVGKQLQNYQALGVPINYHQSGTGSAPGSYEAMDHQDVLDRFMNVYRQLQPTYSYLNRVYEVDATTDGYDGEIYYTWNLGLLMQSASWAGKYANIVLGDWNHFLGEQVRDQVTLKEGGKPDITVTPVTAVDNGNLNIQDINEFVSNITSESSILIDGTGKTFKLPLKGEAGTKTSPIILPEMQYALKGFATQKQTADDAEIEPLYYTLGDNTWFQLDNIQATETIGDFVNTSGKAADFWYAIGQDTANGSGSVSFKATNGVEPIKLFSQNQKDVTIITSNGTYTNSLAVKNYHDSLTLDLSSDTAFYKLVSVDTLKGGNSTSRLILKGTNGTVRMSETKGQEGTDADDFKIRSGILDVQTGTMTILKSSGLAANVEGITILNQMIPYNKQVSVGKSSGNWSNGEVVAAGGATLDATDFKSTEEDQMRYTVNSGLDKVIIKQLNTKAIEVTREGGASQYFNTYAEAFQYIKNQRNAGKWTVKILVPRLFDQAANSALKSLTTAEVTDLVLAAADNSTIDNGYMRMRVANDVEVVQMPDDVNVTLENIAVRRTDTTGTTEEKITFANNGGGFGTGLNYQGVNNSLTDVYGGGSEKNVNATTMIRVQSGAFDYIYGGSKGQFTHSGTTSITIAGTATVNTVDGASEQEIKKQTNKDVTISVETTGTCKIQNIYNYDTMHVKSDLTVTNTIQSDKAFYDGATLITGGKTLTLESDASIRHMGSVKVADGATADANLKIAKATGITNNKTNPFLVQLTGKTPVSGTDKTYRVNVAYTGSTQPEDGDIVFCLPNAANPLADITTAYLKNGFGSATLGLTADIPEKTIILSTTVVGIRRGDKGAFKGYWSVKDAIEDATGGLNAMEKTSRGGDYTLVFFKDGYFFSEMDINSMKEQLATTTANKITWSSNYRSTGETVTTPFKVNIAGDVSFFGKSTVLQDIALVTDTEANLFAEGKPLEVATGVTTTGTVNLFGGGTNETNNSVLTIRSGSFQTVYGGGTAAQTGDANVVLSGGKVGTLYGGGKNAAVNGNVVLNITGGTMEETGEVYGSGANGIVGGTTDITYTVQNAITEKTEKLKTISGGGTDANGAFIDNVNGRGTAKTIKIKMAGTTHTGSLDITNITGFDKLEIGNAQNTEPSRNIVRVNGRFDSLSVTPAVDDNTRRGTVELYCALLALNADTPGHIGSIRTQGQNGSVLTVRKLDSGVTVPLKIDADENSIDASQPLRLAAARKDQVNADDQRNDRILAFVNGAASSDEARKYRESVNRYDVAQEDEGNTTYIYFEGKTHLSSAWIEYPDNVPDQNGKPATTKRGYLIYDKENEHNVRLQNSGYIIAMPKTAINSMDSTKYTKMDEQFRTNGTFSSAMTGLTYYPFNFVRNSNIGAGGVYEATASVDITNIDTENNWYIAHVVCEHGDDSSFIMDIHSPQKAQEAVATEYDTKTNVYTYELLVRDYFVKDSKTLPTKRPGANADKYRMQYISHGVAQAYWAFGALDGSGMTSVDMEAVKKTVTAADATGTAGLYNTVTINTVAAGGTGGTVSGELTAKLVLKVPATLVEAHKDQAIWVYVKDSANNTAKLAIPLSDHIIDVSVPMEIGVVALKSKIPGASPNLLAPDATIRNNGTKKVEVQIIDFATTQTQAELSIVAEKKGTQYNPNEITLFVKKTGGVDKVDVKKLAQTPLGVGTLAATGQAGSELQYTFTADYDPININQPSDLIRNTLSYHFKLVEGN